MELLAMFPLTIEVQLSLYLFWNHVVQTFAHYSRKDQLTFNDLYSGAFLVRFCTRVTSFHSTECLIDSEYH